MATPIETAFVEILPDFQGFMSDIRKSMAEMTKVIEDRLKGVENRLDTMGHEISSTIQNTATASANAFDELSRSINRSLEKTSDKAEEVADSIEDDAQEAGDALDREVSQGARAAERAINGLMRTMIKTVAVFAAATVAMTATLGVVSALSGGFTAMSAAIVASLNAIPGMISGFAAFAAVIATVKVATSGMGAAFAAAAEGDAAKLDEAMKNLSPNAQELVRAFSELKPQLDEIRASVQDAFFEGMADDFNRLAETLSGPVGEGMTIVAGQLNEMISGFADVLVSADSLAALEGIFGNAAVAIDMMEAPLARVLEGFLAISSVGGDSFRGFMDGLAEATTAFGDFLVRASEVGFADALGELFDPAVIMENISGLFTSLLEFIAESIPKLAQSILEGREAFFNAVLEVFSAIVEVLPEIIPSVIEALFGLISSLATTLAEAAPLLLGAAVDMISGIVEGITTTLPTVIESAGTIIKELIDALIEAAPLLVEGAAALIIGLVEGLAENLPMILEGALEIVSGLVMAILDQIPALIDAGLTLMQALVEGLIEFLPAFAEFVISDLLPTLLDTISTQLPLILETGMELLTELLFGLLEALPKIQMFILNDLLPALIKALIKLAPIMIETGLTLLTSLVEGFTDFLPDLITFITDTFIPTFIDTITEEMPLIIETGITVIEALITGFSEAAPQIFSMIVTELIPGVVEAALKGGAKLGAAAGEWLQNMLRKLRDKGPEIWEWFKSLPGRIISAIGKLDTLLLDKAKEIIDGFIQGIRNAFGKVKDAFGDLTDLIPSWKGPRSVDVVLLRGPARAIMEGFSKDLTAEADRVVKPALSAITGGLAVSAMVAPPAGTGGMEGMASAPGSADDDTFVGSVTIDLGEGISKVVDIKMRRKDRDLKRRIQAGTGAAA